MNLNINIIINAHNPGRANAGYLSTRHKLHELAGIHVWGTLLANYVTFLY